MVLRVYASALASAAVVALAGGAAAGCGSSAPAAGSSPAVSPTSAAAPSPASNAGASSGAAAGCGGQSWRSAPITVTHHVSVPPVPVIKAVRVAQHPECGYDRVVLDVGGRVPGYSVRYVSAVVGDASGRTITIPGARYLLITLQPAQAHTDTGKPTVTSGVRQPRYPALASWALAGDFEGSVRIALGLAGQVSVRTGELPGRIYIDVKE
jgi:hypothetical protein